ncbi:hypothetical protein [Moraxella lacunata]|uniref:hypothetical protein n=1 Tax=Moraxella lacunata TaxID=477 RepID=UPI003EDFC94F
MKIAYIFAYFTPKIQNLLWFCHKILPKGRSFGIIGKTPPMIPPIICVLIFWGMFAIICC